MAEVVSLEQLDGLNYPQLASIKFDGIRCLLHPIRGPVSRSFKPIPNFRLREWLGGLKVYELDGEILIFRRDEDGSKHYLDYNPVQSHVMSEFKALPSDYHFEYVVFDSFSRPDEPYGVRYELASQVIEWAKDSKIQLVEQVVCRTKEDILEYYEKILNLGYEGIMVRSPSAPYKSGRSTLRQQYLLKMKPIHEDEGIVVDSVPLETNENEAEQDLFGLTKRSSHKGGKRQTEQLGAFIVNTTQWGEVRVGSGFTAIQRSTFWKNRDSLMGATILFKYQSLGMKDKPRFPRFTKLKG